MTELFSNILIKLLPLYLLIIIGYIAGRFLKIERAGVAPLLLYIVVPIVVFRGIFITEINTQTLSYPLFYLITSILMSVIFYFLGKKVFNGDKVEAALLSMASSLSNVGFFGIPLILLLFGNEVLGIVVLLTLGFTIHENTLAYFLVVKGASGTKNALLRTLKLPIVSAVLFAVVANQAYYKYFLISFPEEKTKLIQSIVDTLIKTMDYFVGALTVLGMLMVGLGLSQINKIKFNPKFINLSLFSQFIVYPALALAFVFLNNSTLHYYSSEVMQIIFLLSLVPIGSNTLTIASRLKMDNGTLSFAVLISTVLSLFVIPFAVVLFGKYF